jgi:SET domain-containing protein
MSGNSFAAFTGYSSRFSYFRCMILSCLYIDDAGDKGRGVFTSEALAKGTILEISPVLVLSPEERKAVEETKLYHYVFEWGDDYKSACVAWGYVSMYNHSYNANCLYEMDYENSTMTIKTVKAVKKGAQLFVNYNAVPDDQTKVWFDTK